MKKQTQPNKNKKTKQIKNKKNKDKQTKTQKKSKTLMLITLVIIAIIIITITTITTVKQKQQQNNNQTTQQEEQQEEPDPEYTLIDLNNTENAEIKDGVKQNTSNKLAQEKTYKGMTIKNIKLAAEGGITKFTATVENKTNTNYEGGLITVIFKNEDGSEYSKLETILPPIDAGKTNEIDAGTTADIANAYDFEIQ